LKIPSGLCLQILESGEKKRKINEPSSLRRQRPSAPGAVHEDASRASLFDAADAPAGTTAFSRRAPSGPSRKGRGNGSARVESWPGPVPRTPLRAPGPAHSARNESPDVRTRQPRPADAAPAPARATPLVLHRRGVGP